MAAESASSSSPLAVLMSPGKLQDKPSQLKAEFNKWVAVQPPWVEGLSSGFFGAFQGAFLGGLMGTMTKGAMDPGAAGGPTAQMMKMGGPMQQARNFAVMTGVNSGLSSFMRRYRGVDDIQNTLVAGFGSGACFSLVSGMGSNASAAMPGGSPNPIIGAFSAGFFFALFQGAFYKLGESFSGPKKNETEYARVKAMLQSLGLDKYEKNLKRANLNDTTIMLWDTEALQEAKVPAGDRLLIQHHINQFKGKAGVVRDLLNPAMPVSA